MTRSPKSAPRSPPQSRPGSLAISRYAVCVPLLRPVPVKDAGARSWSTTLARWGNDPLGRLRMASRFLDPWIWLPAEGYPQVRCRAIARRDVCWYEPRRLHGSRSSQESHSSSLPAYVSSRSGEYVMLIQRSSRLGGSVGSACSMISSPRHPRSISRGMRTSCQMCAT